MQTQSIAGKKLILIGLLAFTLLIPSWAVAGPGFNKIVVFGTSLSDSGNFFAETHIVNTAPGYDVNFFLVPNSAYAIGGHHLSNGPTWIEQFAKSLGMKASVLPAFRDRHPHAMNYATAGTRAFISPDLPEIADSKTFTQQVDQFLIDVGFDEVDNLTPAPPDALYVIEIGSNDVRDAVVIFLNTLEETEGDLAAAQAAASLALATSLGVIADQVVRLRDAGAHQFLYMLVPPIQKTPAIKNLDAFLAATTPSDPGDVINLADSLTLSFNFLPGFGLTTVFATIPGIDHTPFDVHTLTCEIVEAPGDFGLENATDACINPFNAPWKCKNPDEYLFWDGIHPTEAGHGIIAGKAAEVLIP